MPEKIYEYADRAWQPVLGCSPNMPCAPRCWAVRIVNRLAHSPNPKVRAAHEGLVEARYPGDRDPGLRWTGTVRLNEPHLLDPLRWRKPAVVASGYHGDWMRLPAEDIDRVMAVMALCPQHRFLTLTKQPRAMVEYFARLQKMADDWLEKLCAKEPHKKHSFTPSDALNMRWMINTMGHGPAFPYGPWPLPNVFLGVSCMTQADADAAREPMAALAAAGWKTWVSAEPQIGRINWRGWEFIRWLAIGGESGTDPRPFDIAWMRDGIAWGRAANIPVFAKQLGRRITGLDLSGMPYSSPPRHEGFLIHWVSLESNTFGLCDRNGSDPSGWPEDLRVRQLPEGLRV